MEKKLSLDKVVLLCTKHGLVVLEAYSYGGIFMLRCATPKRQLTAFLSLSGKCDHRPDLKIPVREMTRVDTKTCSQVRMRGEFMDTPSGVYKVMNMPVNRLAKLYEKMRKMSYTRTKTVSPHHRSKVVLLDSDGEELPSDEEPLTITSLSPSYKLLSLNYGHITYVTLTVRELKMMVDADREIYDKYETMSMTENKKCDKEYDEMMTVLDTLRRTLSEQKSELDTKLSVSRSAISSASDLRDEAQGDKSLIKRTDRILTQEMMRVMHLREQQHTLSETCRIVKEVCSQFGH